MSFRRDSDITDYRMVVDRKWTRRLPEGVRSHGVFTPEQDTDKTTTRQMLNLCIPMTPFTPDMSELV